jgi:hypothetical protein
MLGKAAKAVLSLGVAIVFSAALATADKGKMIDIYVDAVLPDGQELKAGKYQVVVDEAGKEVQFLKDKKVVVKHRCQCVEKGEKNRYNQARYVEGPEKKQRLTEIRLAGKTCVVHLDVSPGT